MELMLKVAERAAVMALHEAPSTGGRSGMDQITNVRAKS